MSFREAVLLMDDATHTFRVVGLTQPHVTLVLERVHVGSAVMTREWRASGQTDLNGNRIFREVVAPAREAPECPLFDERDVKFPAS